MPRPILCPKTPFLFLTLILTLLLVSPSKSVIVCPDPSDLDPCTCDDGQDTLTCIGDLITPDSIQNLFYNVRLFNNITDTDWLELNSFRLTQTDLTTFELAPFAQTFFSSFDISHNFLLSKIEGAVNSTEEIDLEPWRFSVGQLTLTNGGLLDSDLAEFFKFVQNPENVTSVFLTANKLGGTLTAGEIFPSSSNYGQLHWLAVVGNELERIEGGQFELNNQLTYLGLTDNRISILGQNAFKMEEPTEEWADKKIRIRLDGNQLTNENIHPDNGLPSIGRPVELILNSNNFEFISAENFQDFLLADDRNYVELHDCLFICDERMQWLRDQREDFESRVIGVECQNDKGKNIFTTDLLP